MMNKIATVLTICLSLVITYTHAQVVYVDQGASGTGDGASWTNAFTNLQGAIDAASTVSTVANPIQVWVKADTYYPTAGTDRSISFNMKNEVEIYGGFAGTETLLSQRDWNANITILSGDIGVQGVNTDNSKIIISNSNFPSTPLTLTAILDGFIVEDGYLDDPVFIGGAGMRNNNSSPTVRNCTFRNHVSTTTPTTGGGAAIYNGGESHPAIYNSIFHDNSAHNGPAITFGSPASAFSHTIESVIANCLFYDNTASSIGGAVYVYNYRVGMYNNTFHNNSALSQGGGVFWNVTSTPDVDPILVNNVFWNNSASFDNQIRVFYGSGTPANPTYGPNLIEGGFPSSTSLVVTDDPEFNDAANQDFTVQHCSPIVNAGDNSIPINSTVDLAGNTRTFGTNVDLGAYEIQTTPLFFAAVETEDVTCNGLTDGQINVNGGGGLGSQPIQYSIDGVNFSTNSVFGGLSGGTYTITLLDQANSCTYAESFTITEPSEISISSLVPTNISCNGANNGLLSIEVTGGATPYQVSFDGGSTFVSSQFTAAIEILNLTPGSYTVTIVDGNGCSFTNPTTTILSEPSVLTSSFIRSDVDCHNDTDGSIEIIASGGTAPYSYSLDGINFQAGFIFTDLAAGNYTVSIKDANDCISTFNESISQPSPLGSVAISASHVDCYGGSDGSFSFEGSGGTAPYEYSLDGVNFQTSPLMTGLTAGTYTLTIRDSNLCAISLNWTVTEPDLLTGTLTATGTSSCGLSDGTLTVASSGGTSPYQYSLDGGTTTQASATFSGLPSGAYTVTLIDSQGCELEINESVDDPATATISTSVTNILCHGDASGTIEVLVTGGSSPIEYSLDGVNYQASNAFPNLTADTYSVYVKESNGCTQSVTATITEPTQLVGSKTKDDPSCFGENDGAIEVIGSGGVSPYEYSIDNTNYQAAGTFSNLTDGTYTLTIRDSNNCTVQLSETLTDPLEVTATAAVTDATCQGSADGVITVSQANGITPLAYSLDGGAGQASNVFDQLNPGTYTVLVTDANGCGVTLSDVTVGATTSIIPTLSTTHILCASGSTGEISVTATGGTSPYEFSINNEAFQGSNVFSGLSAGSYQVAVRDADGCLGIENVTLTEPDALQITVVQNDKSFEITASGGLSPYEFSTDGVTFQSSGTFSNLDVGDYTFRVRDANGCVTESDEFSIILGLTDVAEEIKLFPNPVSNYFHVDSKDVDQIAIYNLGGKLIKSVPNQEKVVVSDLDTGLYLILMKNIDQKIISVNRLIKD
ncbi:MAG: T9SS type A sorting domain-containing protein [Ekhidna sp.]